MKIYFRRLLTAALFLISLQYTTNAQVIHPDDPIVEYTGGNVQQPNWGQVGDWVKTTRLNWNTDDFKCYIYKGNMFRLKFPKSYQHGVNDGKKYPIYVFFHGLGEAASEDGETFNLYDNEFHLLHGGQRHKDFVQNDQFDGFLLYMQNQFGFFGAVHHDAVAELIQNFLVPQNKGDIDRVIVNGLSAGGGAVWDFTIRYPQLVASCLPISNAAPYISNSANILRFIPIWHFQGGRDNNPKPATSEAVGQAILNAGGSYRYTLYPTLGHGVWNNSWSEPDYLPFINAAHKANPVPLYTKYEFCVGETPDVTLGLTAGFAQYEWRRNGVVISGATSNTYRVTQYGTYDCRFRRTSGGAWSVWSPKPIVVKLKDPTVPPDITTKGLQSWVIPAPDGNNGVTLQQPTGYLTYNWTRVGNSNILGTSDTFRVTSAGDYVVKTTEPFGCLSEFSNPFKVVNANGPNKPSPASNVVATGISRTEMKIDWVENPAPQYNETNYEVYQSSTAGGPYTLVGITAQDVTTFTVTGLTEGSRHYYIVRAVNTTGASPLSTEVAGTTVPDNSAPTAPAGLRIISSTDNSVELDWNPSSDNVGVELYDIYINNVKSYSTTSNAFTCFNLTVADSGYMFVVRARDAAGNESLPSNQVFGIPPVNVTPAPAAPTNITATTVSHKRINVSWTDNSNNETKFEILRSTNPTTGFHLIGTRAANITSYVDTVGLIASTTYYYRVRAAYQFGGSDVFGPVMQANWKFNNTYTDATGNNRTISGSGTTFNASDRAEGSHAISFNGTSNYVNVTTSSNDYIRGTNATKTIAFWMKSNSNTGNRIIFDFGGSDDGMAARLDGNVLYAGVASNNTRRSISTPYTSTGWNHIAIVYNSSTLRLYVNAVEVASNTALGFTSLGTTSNASRIGNVNSSNAFNTGTGFFSGLLDDFQVYETPLTVAQISNIRNLNPASTIPQASATTLAPPAVPVAPTALLAGGISKSSIKLNWTDNANNETKYEVYRSYNNNSNFVLIRNLPANATTFTETGLYATSIAYYKVQAVNETGGSGFSNEDSARTFTEVPDLNPIENQYMRYGTVLQVNISASSNLSGDIDIDIDNLPSFGSYTSNGNGTGTLSFSPSVAQQGVYPNITITASDDFNGSSSVSFQLVVNDNHNPVMAAIANVVVNESSVVVRNLSSTDQNAGDVLSYSFTGLPSFVTVTQSGNNAQLNIAPGFGNHGVYNVVAKVQDNNNGSHTRSFTITVNDVNPTKRIFVNFTDGGLGSPSPWNGTNKAPQLNDNFPSLLDEEGVTTTVGMQITSPWGNIGNGSNVLGVNTTSGIYPSAVIRSAYWTNTSPQTISIYGLDPARQYSFTFFGSRDNVNDNRTSVYTMKGISVSLNAASNSQNTVTIPNLTPEADGSLVLTLSSGAGSSFAYLNAMVIESVFDDGSAPAKPRNLAAQYIGGQVRLNWTDQAYNEDAYQVWRSTDPGEPFVLLNPGGNNSNLQSYNDGNIAGSTTYYYTVRATNSDGNSPYSDTISITTGNAIPSMNVIPNVTMRIQEIQSVNVTVTDDADDIITLSSTGLPHFVTLVDNGDGTGVLNIDPQNSIGIFNNITITARDDKGATTSRSFRIVVRDVFNSVYVNFSNSTNYPAPSPWNSFTSVPFQGKQLTNMIDDSETPTGINILQVTSWEGANDQGATTGLETGVFPDNVMKTVYYQSGDAPMVSRISGLNPVNTRYNLVFFASRLAGDIRNTVYTANGVSVTLNASNNTQNTVQINGLIPDANGVIEFTCAKAPGSPYAYLGAMVIQSYVDNGTPFAPSGLKALAKSKTSIELTWTDKSSDESGFQIWRAESFTGPYVLINTTAPNATSYVDATGLQTAKVYYYRVRGVKGDVLSEYTNIASTSTYLFSVFMNINRSNSAPSPWNNTSRAPEEGRVFSNLRNDLGNNSGLSMTIVQNFSGDNPSGMNTGNNSGIFPDNVLRSSWWVDAGVTSILKISNLNKTWTYSFVFTGSRNGGGDRTSIYTINGKSVSLNASFNTQNTVQIDDIKPDENGEVFLTVSLSQYAMFAYLNALVIHGYKPGEEGSIEEVVNPALQANAGQDIDLTLPNNSTQLQGSTVDGNGTVVSYSWTKTSGPAQFSIDNNALSNPTLSNLEVGTYVFTLTASDNAGGLDTDEVTIVVNPAPSNTPPTANAGADVDITLPVNSVQLSGSGTDNGSIVGYNWVRTAGPVTYSIDNSSINNPTLSSLVEGTYTFELTVTDNLGATATDEVNVIVSPSTGPKIIRVNMTGGLNQYSGTDWNNWNSVSNWSSQQFNYSDGTASGISAAISNQQGMSDNGAAYSTTAVPNEVGRYASYTTLNRTLTISGLDPAKTYTLEVFGSRSGSAANTTRYTVGAASVDINVTNNSSNLAVFSAIAPTAGGQIELSLQRLNTYNYLNAWILTEDGSGEEVNARIVSEAHSEEIPVADRKFAASPNPFRDHVMVSADFETAQDKVTLRMIDATGKVVVNQFVGPVAKGKWSYRLDVSRKELKPGTYIIQVLSPGSKTPPASLKLIRTE